MGQYKTQWKQNKVKMKKSKSNEKSKSEIKQEENEMNCWSHEMCWIYEL